MKSFKDFIQLLESWSDYKVRPTNKGEFKIGKYDTDFYDKEFDTERYRDNNGKLFATFHRLVPKRPINNFVDDLIPKDENVIHRGISHDEYENILKTGKIESRGNGNLGDEQKGLTYFTTNPHTAANYASDFAINQHKKPTREKPAYIISIKKPDESKIKHVEGVGEHEVGVIGHIPASEITAIYRGNVIEHTPRNIDRNLSYMPYKISTKEDWKKVKNQLGGIKTGNSSRLHWEKIK